ncbi:Zinc-dependent alcohol dehydrogenase [Phytophthora palmivora]|uniref:Zinc-dependent alcohol dehydrogenase n=1 Tax=Phytophthora palmivora TaxID=4796 RepID=A0A2P4YLI2_9STRA|nr:Zinc-dependent alcohol dehydrogenase [Phytophthora palmivora]
MGLCYEGAGYVAAIGDCNCTHLKNDDLVGVKWLANSCLSYEDCRKSHESRVWMLACTDLWWTVRSNSGACRSLTT